MAEAKNEYDGPLDSRVVAFFVVFGAVGAIIMSWISYAGVVLKPHM